MLKFSIVIPIYNMQEYLNQSLDSVINQTYKNLEIICVNDGSKDNSLAIIKQYAEKDKRIKVIDKMNGGVSSARNAGIASATGDYIMFLDPDDAYDLTLCEKVAQKIDAEHADIVMWAHLKLKDNVVCENNIKQLKRLTVPKYKKILKHQIGAQIYVWDKAFKKELLKDNQITFAKGIKCAEDMIFCSLCYFLKPTYSYIDEPLYFYTVGRAGAVTTQNPECILNDLTAYKYICNTEEFKKQSYTMQLLITNHFLGGSVEYHKKATDSAIKNRYIQDIKIFLKFVFAKFGIIAFVKIKSFRKLLFLVMRNNRRPQAV